MAFLSKFFNKSEPTALGIDIGSSAIKIVQVTKKNGQAVLDTYGELALGPYANLEVGQAVALPTDKIAQALVDLMHEKEVSVTTNRCGLSIPFSSSLMSVIELPEVNPKQLASMVPLEARKYIPVPISEVMLDWSVIPKTEVKQEEPASFPLAMKSGMEAPKPRARMDILMVAIHNETIARYQDIVARSGLDAGFFEIEIFSTMRAVLEETLKPVMIMDIGAASTKLYIIERGIVRSSHTVNRGAQDITSAISKSLGISMSKAEVMKRQVGLTSGDQAFSEAVTLVLDHIFADANSVLLAFEKKHNKSVSQVVLVGGGSALKGLAPLAKQNFKTDVVQADPFSKVSAPAFLENVLKETGPEFAVAIGLALRKLSEEE